MNQYLNWFKVNGRVLNVSEVERQIGCPPTTLAQFIRGTRELGKWERPLINWVANHLLNLGSKKDMNAWIFHGNLGSDAQVKDVQGNSVIEFSVAISEKWTDREGQKHEKTHWVSCQWWIKNTAVAEYLKKGTTVIVEGKPSAGAYLSEGEAKEVLNCRVNKLDFVGSRKTEDDF